MDDIGSAVVGGAHEVGSWRGPAERPWLRRIAHGAGFGNPWDALQLADDPVRDGLDQSTSRDATTAAMPDEVRAARSLRMWWLPSAADG